MRLRTASMLTDTHCHLDYERFDPDREAVIGRARDAGLGRILNPGLDLETSRAAVELAESHDLVFAAVGVQPNAAGAWDPEAEGTLRALARSPKVVAIGEIGLDYYWDKYPHDLQKRVFRWQLELAAALSLPVVIHNRDSDRDVVDMLLAWQAELAASNHPLAARPGVMHAFSAGESDARRVIAAGFSIGIAGPVTFKNAPELHALVAALPLESILIETDSPFLSPHPFRGKRNEPARVQMVAQAIADLKGLELSDVVRQTAANANRLFAWE